MKRLLPAAAALLFIAAVVLLVLARREIDDLRGEVAVLRKERDAQRTHGPSLAQKSSPLSAKTSAPGADSKTGTTGGEAATKEKPEGGFDLFMGAGKAEIETRSAARLALLRDRLKLRPDQMATLQKQAAARSESLISAFERIKNNTARPPDLGLLMDWVSGRFDLAVKDVLDATQAEAFASFDTEDRASRIENLVNIELIELHGQGDMQLTTEQKDQVFARLTEIVAAEDALGNAYYADDAQFGARIDDSLRRRREALQPVLDAAQLQSYGRMLEEDRTLIEGMFSRNK